MLVYSLFGFIIDVLDSIAVMVFLFIFTYHLSEPTAHVLPERVENDEYDVL